MKNKRKTFLDKNGNLFYYDDDKYGYIVKRCFKLTRKRKNGNNVGE